MRNESSNIPHSQKTFSANDSINVISSFDITTLSPEILLSSEVIASHKEIRLNNCNS